MGRVLFAVAAFWMMVLPLPAQQANTDADKVDSSKTAPAVAATPVPDEVKHIGSKYGVTPPKLIHQVDPAFSEEARKKKINGNVELYVIVDEQGLPQTVRVKRSLGYGLDEAAVAAVKQYRFTPAMKDGMPVKVDLYIDVNFQIYKRWPW